MQDLTVDQRMSRALVIGAIGAGVATAICFNDPLFSEWWAFVRAATTGAFFAGWVCAGGFGGGGPVGWMRALGSFAAATLLGAAVAVPVMLLELWLAETVVMEVLNGLALLMLAGPVFVAGMMAETYIVWAAWAAGFIALQGRLIWGR